MPDTPPPGPYPRDPLPGLTEADRERLLTLLREHFARGLLDLDEMSERVGAVLASAHYGEAAAAVAGLPPLAGPAAGQPPPARDNRARIGQRKRHAQQVEPGAGWVPTPERFRDPSTRAIVRVWVDPADLSRHYVPEQNG